MKITVSQRSSLNAIFQRGEHGLQRSCTNPSLCALDRKGRVRWEMKDTEFSHVKAIGDLMMEHWFLTDAGKSFLHPAPRTTSNASSSKADRTAVNDQPLSSNLTEPKEQPGAGTIVPQPPQTREVG